MKVNPYLSFTKRKILRRFAVILLLLFFFDFSFALWDSYNRKSNQAELIKTAAHFNQKSGIEFEFAEISPVLVVPLFNFLLLFFCFSLVFSKKYLMPLSLSALIVSTFVWEIISTHKYFYFEEPPNTFEIMLRLASPINWLEFTIILSLFFWLNFNLLSILIFRNDKTSSTGP